LIAGFLPLLRNRGLEGSMDWFERLFTEVEGSTEAEGSIEEEEGMNTIETSQNCEGL
jgi:hypothetical protein